MAPKSRTGRRTAAEPCTVALIVTRCRGWPVGQCGADVVLAIRLTGFFCFAGVVNAVNLATLV